MIQNPVTALYRMLGGGRKSFRLNYIDTTKNTCIRRSTFTEIMAREVLKNERSYTWITKYILKLGRISSTCDVITCT
jgi:hypothetical protein